jgi:hypothetical protein
MTLTRDSAGRVTTATTGAVIETWTYDPFGSVALYGASSAGSPTLAFAGTSPPSKAPTR